MSHFGENGFFLIAFSSYSHGNISGTSIAHADESCMRKIAEFSDNKMLSLEHPGNTLATQ
jgi:hypothetical protein